jgi:hypothetical protein
LHSLSEADRRFLDRIAQQRGAASEKPEASGVALSGNRGFEGLPGDAEQKFLRMAGAKLGVSSPYFLMHEGDAGAETVIDGKKLINFSSYDYLGLNHHPDVRRAAVEAIERYGVSASASRLVAGERPVHRALEAALGRH